jgi:hypothetical protein
LFEIGDPVMKVAVLILVNFLLVLSGCSDNTTSYPSAVGKSKPYILKEGCTFSIVKEYGSASVDSPVVSGVAGATASATVSIGDIAIKVSNCMVVENPEGLPIYQDHLTQTN